MATSNTCSCWCWRIIVAACFAELGECNPLDMVEPTGGQRWGPNTGMAARVDAAGRIFAGLRETKTESLLGAGVESSADAASAELAVGSAHLAADMPAAREMMRKERRDMQRSLTKGTNEASHALSLSNSKVNISIASVESFGFIDEDDASWKLRSRVHMRQMELERAKPSQGAHGTGRVWWQTHYEPSFHCEFAERLGDLGDGGKWVCDPDRIRENVLTNGAPCLVYSVGSNGKFGFEQDIMNRISPSCEVHTFDPAPAGSGLPQGASYHQWPLGVDGTSVQGVEAKSLAKTADELGHKNRTIDIFKIDCEGCEWTTYDSWFDGGLDIRQIQVELHWPHLPGNSPSDKATKAHKFYNYLFDRGYVVFSKEPNTLGCSGECIEYSFLKLSPAFGQNHSN